MTGKSAGYFNTVKSLTFRSAPFWKSKKLPTIRRETVQHFTMKTTTITVRFLKLEVQYFHRREAPTKITHSKKECTYGQNCKLHRAPDTGPRKASV